jgi:hypothetical protein
MPGLFGGGSLPADDASLLGTWDVAFTDTAGDGPMAMTLMIDTVEDGKVEGRIGGKPFLTSRSTVSEGELHWAATTRGEDGPFFHDARLVGGELHGTTLSIGQDTFRGWTARKRAPN